MKLLLSVCMFVYEREEEREQICECYKKICFCLKKLITRHKQ